MAAAHEQSGSERARIADALAERQATVASPVFLQASDHATAFPKMVAECTDVVLLAGANARFRAGGEASRRGLLVVRQCANAEHPVGAVFPLEIEALGGAGDREIAREAAVGAVDVFAVSARIDAVKDPLQAILEALLPARAPSPGPDVTSLAPPLAQPLGPRLRKAARASEDAGYTVSASKTVPVAVQGTEPGTTEIAVIPMDLLPGCHRLAVLFEPRAAPRYDIDADVIERLEPSVSGSPVQGARILASDKGDGADATLGLCVATPTAITIRVQGFRSVGGTLHIVPAARPFDAALRTSDFPSGGSAAASVRAVSSPPLAVPGGRAAAVLRAVSSPPLAVPGGRAAAVLRAVSSPPLAVPGGRAAALTAAVATALRARGVADLHGDLRGLRQGIGGRTGFVMPVVPGHCYVAAVAATEGSVDRLSLAVSGEGFGADDRGGRGKTADGGRPGGEDVAAMVAFCTDSHEDRNVQIAAFGRSVEWTFALIDVGAGGMAR